MVAALTMPSLIANYQKSQFEAGVKKVASVTGQAVTKLMADEGVNKVTETSLLYDPTDDGVNNLKLGGEFLDKYFNVVSKCETYEQCFGEIYKRSNANASGRLGPFSYFFGEEACKILADGVSICLAAGNTYEPVQIYFDLNGKRGPNRDGYDLFYFNVYYDGSVSEVTPECRNANNPNCLCSASSDCSIDGRIRMCKEGFYSGYGVGCFTYLQQNGFNWKTMPLIPTGRGGIITSTMW